MKKQYILIVTVVLFACNSNTGPATSTNASTDSVKHVPTEADHQHTEADHQHIEKDTSTQVVALLPEELKDDSVFADGSKPTSWENAGFTDPKGFKLFLKQLQQYVMLNDKEKLAATLNYPLKNPAIKNAEEFIKQYDTYFTRDVKMSFALVNFNQVFRNDTGAMTNGGKVWFQQVGKDFKITAINYK